MYNASASMPASDVVVIGALSSVIALLVIAHVLSVTAFAIVWRKQKKKYQQKLRRCET